MHNGQLSTVTLTYT